MYSPTAEENRNRQNEVVRELGAMYGTCNCHCSISICCFLTFYLPGTLDLRRFLGANFGGAATENIRRMGIESNPVLKGAKENYSSAEQRSNVGNRKSTSTIRTWMMKMMITHFRNTIWILSGPAIQSSVKTRPAEKPMRSVILFSIFTIRFIRSLVCLSVTV